MPSLLLGGRSRHLPCGLPFVSLVVNRGASLQSSKRPKLMSLNLMLSMHAMNMYGPSQRSTSQVREVHLLIWLMMPTRQRTSVLSSAAMALLMRDVAIERVLRGATVESWVRDRLCQRYPSSFNRTPPAEIHRRLCKPLPLHRRFGNLDSLLANMSNLATLATAVRGFNVYNTLLTLTQRKPFCPAFVPRGPIGLLITNHSRIGDTLKADGETGLGVPLAYREPYVGRQPPAGRLDRAA